MISQSVNFSTIHPLSIFRLTNRDGTPSTRVPFLHVTTRYVPPVNTRRPTNFKTEDDETKEIVSHRIETV